MTTQINTKELQAGLKKVMSIKGDKSIEILSTVVLKAYKDRNRVQITRTDLNVTARVMLNCEVGSDFKIVLPDDAIKIVMKMKATDTCIEVGDGSVSISSGKVKVSPVIMDVDEYPELMKPSIDNYVTSYDTKQLIHLASAASKDQARHQLNGVFIVWFRCF